MGTSNTDQTDSQLLPGDYLSVLDFIRACRSLYTIFERLSISNSVPTANNSGYAMTMARSFTALQQVQADLNGNLGRLELAISSQPTGPDSSVSVGRLIRNDIANEQTKDEASAYMAVLWLAR